MSKEDHRTKFDAFCKKTYYGDDDSQSVARSKSITRAKGERIVELLKGNNCQEESKFKYWVNKKRFKLMSYQLLGLNDVLCLPAKKIVSLHCHSGGMFS